MSTENNDPLKIMRRKFFKNAIKENHLDISKLARKLKVSRVTMSTFVFLHYRPTDKMIFKVCKVLDVDPFKVFEMYYTGLKVRMLDDKMQKDMQKFAIPNLRIGKIVKKGKK